MEEQIAQAEQRVHEANANVQAAIDQAKASKADLDQLIFEHEVQKQAVYYGIDQDEARRRIELNRQEREQGVSRTIWDFPNQTGAV